MNECKCGRIPPCYGGKKFRIHEELEGVKPCSEETAQGIIEALRELRNASELEEASNRLAEHIFEDILKSIKSNDMEEKKTKKMTKAEAFEWLNNKKLTAKDNVYVNVLFKLFECGIEWVVGGQSFTYYGSDFLIIEGGKLFHCGNDGENYWRSHHFEEVSADDILSIEIVDEKKDDERKGEILDEIAKLGEKISDLLEEYGGDVIVEIDLFDVILRNSGDILYRKR